MVPYVVHAVTVMCVLLFVLDASMLRVCEGDGNAGVGDGGGVVAVSPGHEYVGGTRGSSIVSSTADVLGLSVLRGRRGVDGVCEMCMCFARGGVGDEGIRVISLVPLFISIIPH